MTRRILAARRTRPTERLGRAHYLLFVCVKRLAEEKKRKTEMSVVFMAVTFHALEHAIKPGDGRLSIAQNRQVELFFGIIQKLNFLWELVGLWNISGLSLPAPEYLTAIKKQFSVVP